MPERVPHVRVSESIRASDHVQLTCPCPCQCREILVLENVRLSPAVLQQRIVYHYGQGFLLQLYRVLGSADFLGNPVGLFTNVSSGVADIFYEPYQGELAHLPELAC